jgi:hypothetical protein
MEYKRCVSAARPCVDLLDCRFELILGRRPWLPECDEPKSVRAPSGAICRRDRFAATIRFEIAGASVVVEVGELNFRGQIVNATSAKVFAPANSLLGS